MGVLSDQALDEVRGVVAVGGLVVVNIVQRGDVEVRDHRIGVGAVIGLFDHFGLRRSFGRLLGRGFGGCSRLGRGRRRGLTAGGEREDHHNCEKHCEKSFHFISSYFF